MQPLHDLDERQRILSGAMRPMYPSVSVSATAVCRVDGVNSSRAIPLSMRWTHEAGFAELAMT